MEKYEVLRKVINTERVAPYLRELEQIAADLEQQANEQKRINEGFSWLFFIRPDSSVAHIARVANVNIATATKAINGGALRKNQAERLKRAVKQIFDEDVEFNVYIPHH